MEVKLVVNKKIAVGQFVEKLIELGYDAPIVSTYKTAIVEIPGKSILIKCAINSEYPRLNTSSNKYAKFYIGDNELDHDTYVFIITDEDSNPIDYLLLPQSEIDRLIKTKNNSKNGYAFQILNNRQDNWVDAANIRSTHPINLAIYHDNFDVLKFKNNISTKSVKEEIIKITKGENIMNFNEFKETFTTKNLVINHKFDTEYGCRVKMSNSLTGKFMWVDCLADFNNDTVVSTEYAVINAFGTYFVVKSKDVSYISANGFDDNISIYTPQDVLNILTPARTPVTNVVENEIINIVIKPIDEIINVIVKDDEVIESQIAVKEEDTSVKHWYYFGVKNTEQIENLIYGKSNPVRLHNINTSYVSNCTGDIIKTDIFGNKSEMRCGVLNDVKFSIPTEALTSLFGCTEMCNISGKSVTCDQLELVYATTGVTYIRSTEQLALENAHEFILTLKQFIEKYKNIVAQIEAIVY
jgi:hypothetical protein